MNMASTADHEILIRLEEGKHAIPPNPMPAMKVGETVRYLSYDGQVTMRFPELSPFRQDNQTNTEVSGSEPQQLLRAGKFESRCFLMLQGGMMVGWDPNGSPQSGGVHDVGH